MCGHGDHMIEGACKIPDNNIHMQGAEALGPHLAKIINLQRLELGGACRVATWPYGRLIVGSAART